MVRDLGLLARVMGEGWVCGWLVCDQQVVSVGMLKVDAEKKLLTTDWGMARVYVPHSTSLYSA